MNKRMFSVVLCVLMIAAAAVSAVPASAAHHDSTTIYVNTDTTQAKADDVIDFSVVLGPVSDVGTMQMVLVIPEGLTYVPGSGKVAEGLKEAMGFDDFNWTEESLMFNGVASEANYESDDETLLGTFRCSVNEDYNGTASVGLTNLEFYDCQEWTPVTDRYSVASEIITIGSGSSSGNGNGNGGNGNGDGGDAPGGNVDPTAPDSGITGADNGETTAVNGENGTENTDTTGSPATVDNASPTTAAKNSKTPGTGDSDWLFVGLALIAASLLAVGATFVVKSKKNS